MFSKALSTAAVALAAVSMVSAQTFTECNPLKKTCPADPAFGDDKVECDFTKGECDAFHGMIGTSLKYDGKGAHFIINKESDAPTIRTDNYIFFGRIDVVVQAAEGQGIVTSAVLQSDDLDEIDWEWVGGDNAQVQTNYFSKGDTTTYDRGAYHPVDAPLTSYHKYSIEWTSQAINWLVDDNVVRTLTAAEAKGGASFPQTPMQVKLGTWVGGGKNTNKGTVEWAGGYTDFKQAPFEAYYKSITIVDYAGKDAPGQNSGAKEYVYGDKSGSWESIEVKKTSSDDDNDEKTTTKATKTAEATKTKSAEPSSTADEEEDKTTEKQTKTKSEESAKTESEESTKTTEAATTFTTAAASTPSKGSNGTATATQGSGSDSSDSEETGSGATPSQTDAGEAEPTISTVPVNSGSRLAGNIVAAAAGIFFAQLLI